MATPPPPRVPFYRNVRVLQWAFQLVVVGVVVAIVLWLYRNYVDNAAERNIPTSLSFLDNPAAFEIPGSQLSQNDAVSEAVIVGILNTLRISVVGIILATILGTLVGIARLSRNWIVSKLAAVYVELVRNIPLLLFVVFGFLVLVLGVLPEIDDAWAPLGWAVMSNRGIAVPWFIGSGKYLLGVLLVAAVAAWAVAAWRRAVFARSGTLARTGLWSGAVFIVIFAAGWVIGGLEATLPEVDGRLSRGGIRVDPSYFALLFALVVYTSSHIAEIVRGSIQAVPRGQGEAANALALGGFQRLWYVVLPQAFRIAIPPIGNQYLNLIKNSSLGAAIGYYDLTLVTRTTVGNGSPAVPAFALAMVIYIAISLVTSAFVNLANRRMALVER